ncbi:MAG: HMA2 domain-containing protein [Synechococcaceae cyanobacterium]
MNSQQLRDLCRILSIAHHIPGRIRIRLDRSALASDLGGASTELDALLASLERLQGIQEVRLNPMALSCTITYDPAAIAADAWVALLEGRTDQDGHQLAELVLRYAERLT